MKRLAAGSLFGVLALSVVACGGGDEPTQVSTVTTSAVQQPAATSAPAAPTAIVTSTKYPPRVAVNEDAFVQAMMKGDGRFLFVNPLGQADQICGKLDAGVDVQTVVNSVLQTLRTEFAADNPYPRVGWTDFDAQFLTGQAAINVCPTHEAAFRAAFE